MTEFKQGDIVRNEFIAHAMSKDSLGQEPMLAPGLHTVRNYVPFKLSKPLVAFSENGPYYRAEDFVLSPQKPPMDRPMLDRLWARLDEPCDDVARDLLTGLPEDARLRFLLIKAKQLLQSALSSDQIWSQERDAWLRNCKLLSRKVRFNEGQGLSGGDDQDQGSDRHQLPGHHPD